MKEIGVIEKSIANVGKFNRYKNLEYYKHILFDPTKDYKCKDCTILPICMGGDCPIRRKNNLDILCENSKKIFDLKIRDTFRSLDLDNMEEVFL